MRGDQFDQRSFQQKINAIRRVGHPGELPTNWGKINGHDATHDCYDGLPTYPTDPDHYKALDKDGDVIEAIDIIEAFGLNYRLGNVLKYILRAGKKGDRNEDLLKALWYLEREIEHE